jgi:hypothetical protein
VIIIEFVGRSIRSHAASTGEKVSRLRWVIDALLWGSKNKSLAGYL